MTRSGPPPKCGIFHTFFYGFPYAEFSKNTPTFSISDVFQKSQDHFNKDHTFIGVTLYIFYIITEDWGGLESDFVLWVTYSCDGKEATDASTFDLEKGKQ